MSSDPRTELPSPSAPNFEQRVRETLMTYLGRQGNPLDRGLTLRDLVNIGMLKQLPGGGIGPPDDDGGGGGGPGDPGDPDDLTPPPTPTGFSVSAGLTYIFAEHDPPLFTEGRGYLRTRLYGVIRAVGAPLPTFADAREISQFTGTVHAYPTNPNTTWHLWIKWETQNNVLSAVPAGGTNGLVATTGQDVNLLLDLLTGQITDHHLYRGLGERIGLIEILQTGITNETYVRQTADEAMAAQLNIVSAVANGNSAAIINEQVARVNGDSANATSIEQLQARLDTGDYAALRIESQVNASKISGLSAQYTVKIDLAGHISGFGLAAEAPIDEEPVSRFGVRANQFFIAPPAYAGPTAPTVNLYEGYCWTDTSVTPSVPRYYNGTAWVTKPPLLPFIVQTTPTTINGVSVPPGVYMRDAFIANGTITNVKIGNAAIDDAKVANLSAAKLTAGDGTIGNVLKSANFIAGTQGWYVDATGNVEMNNAVVRGTVFATNGQFLGTLLGGSASSYISGTGLFSGLHSGSYRWRVGNPGGARIEWEGSNVVVYNASNQVVFSSGSGITIPLANVTGAGAMAAVDFAAIGSTVRIYNGTTGQWETVNWNSFVNYLSKIDSGNIGTFISEAAIGTAYIGNAAINSAKIAQNLTSGNFNGTIDGNGNIATFGTAGWAIDKTGQAVFNNIYARGNIEADRIKANAIDIVGTGNILRGAVSDVASASGVASNPLVVIHVPPEAANRPIVVVGTMLAGGGWLNITDAEGTFYLHAAALAGGGATTLAESPAMITTRWMAGQMGEGYNIYGRGAMALCASFTPATSGYYQLYTSFFANYWGWQVVGGTIVAIFGKR